MLPLSRCTYKECHDPSAAHVDISSCSDAQVPKMASSSTMLVMLAVLIFAIGAPAALADCSDCTYNCILSADVSYDSSTNQATTVSSPSFAYTDDYICSSRERFLGAIEGSIRVWSSKQVLF